MYAIALYMQLKNPHNLYLNLYVSLRLCSVKDIMHSLKHIGYLFYQFHFHNINFLHADLIDFSLAKRRWLHLSIYR